MNEYQYEFITDENREECASWIDRRCEEGLKFMFRPPRGFIATLNGKRIACIYFCGDLDNILLYGMWLTTNPDATVSDKKGVVQFLLGHLNNFAKYNKYQMLKYDTPCKSLVRIFHKMGYISGDIGCTQLLKGV